MCAVRRATGYHIPRATQDALMSKCISSDRLRSQSPSAPLCSSPDFTGANVPAHIPAQPLQLVRPLPSKEPRKDGAVRYGGAKCSMVGQGAVRWGGAQHGGAWHGRVQQVMNDPLPQAPGSPKGRWSFVVFQPPTSSRSRRAGRPQWPVPAPGRPRVEARGRAAICSWAGIDGPRRRRGALGRKWNL